LNYFSLQKTRYTRSRCLSLLFVTLSFFFFVSPANAYDAVIAWDSNSEPNLAGYVLYVDDGFSEILYEYVDTYPLEDLDTQNPTIKITDLRDDWAYYFVVTAYDTDGYESDFSDEICVINGEPCPESWSASRIELLSASNVNGNSAGTSVSSSGGGSSGGCFISSFNYTENNNRGISSQHIILLLIYIGVFGIFSLLDKKTIKTRFKRIKHLLVVHNFNFHTNIKS